MAKAVVLTRPIANYMDTLSLIETLRHRMRLKDANLLPPTSTCAGTNQDLVSANMRILAGQTGLDVLHEYFSMLQAPCDLVWSPDFGLSQDDCLGDVVMAMCDCYRRLVMPFESCPWQLFKIVDMSSEQGLPYLHGLGLRSSHCRKRCDPSFTEVPCLA